MSAAPSFFADWRDAVLAAFRYHKNFADRAVAQIDFAAIRQPLDEHTNSIAVNMKHVAGNLASRWTDFLTSDGEKPWRNRDDEFVDNFLSADQLKEFWDRGWNCVETTLANLTEADMEKSVVIRGDRHSIPMAVERSLAHTAYHVGQIVILARHWAGDRWKTITIPRGGSAKFNDRVWNQGDYGRRSQG